MKTSLRILNLEDSPADANLIAKMISARWSESETLRADTRAAFIRALKKTSSI